MPLPYDVYNWYWNVAGVPGVVYSSLVDNYVSTSAPAYTSWQSSGGQATNIPSEFELGQVLAPSFQQPIPANVLNGYNAAIDAQQPLPAVGVRSSVNATSPSTGAFQCLGGAGITKDLWVGGTINGTVVGYQPLDADLTSLAALTGTNTIYYRSSAGGAWTAVTIGSGLSFSGGTLSAPGGVTPAALTKTDDTNVTLALGGTPATALLQATSITVGWSGTLAATRGGTGTGTYALGDILYSNATNALAKLAGNTTSAKQYLSQTGTGTVSAAPAWAAIAGADVAGAALTKTDDTNVTLTLGGTPATSLLRASSITVGWTGTLAVARGGIGVGTITGLMQGNGTSAVTGIANSSTIGQVLRVTGAATYGWGAVDLADTDAITGDLPFGNLAQGSALSVLGVTGNATADVASIAAGADGNVMRRSGTALGFGTIDLANTTGTVGTSRLQPGNFQQGIAMSLLGVAGNATADVAAIAAGSDGAVMRRSGVAIGFGAIDLTNPNAVSGRLGTANQTQAVPWTGGYVAGRYYMALLGGGTTGFVVSANILYFVPFQVGETHTFDRIGMNVATGASGNAKLAIYNNANGQPTSLVVDGGAVSTTSIALVAATISQSLNPGIYWLAVVFNAAPTVTGITSTQVGWVAWTGMTNFGTPDTQLSATFTYPAGAMPSNITFGAGGIGAATYTGGTTIPMLALRA